MTRLITEWIKEMDSTVALWNIEFKRITGMDLVELAAKGCGKSYQDLQRLSERLKVAVIPITSGEGIIGSFADSVAAIVAEMGFHTIVTGETDVAGLYEAEKEGADIVYFADDNRYLAMNLNQRALAENDRATATGYILALEGMLDKQQGETLRDKRVLQLGYGRVGKVMSELLVKKGAQVTVYDKHWERMEEALENNLAIIQDPLAIKNFTLITDATSEGPWLNKELLNKEALIAAPGIPYSLDEETEALYPNSSVHDNLEIGTAVMLGMALGR
ncbi:MAG: 3-methylornithyl-N6-L-lysine dehydrogenase PylD [Anaerovoracaceae bacterium]